MFECVFVRPRVSDDSSRSRLCERLALASVCNLADNTSEFGLVMNRERTLGAGEQPREDVQDIKLLAHIAQGDAEAFTSFYARTSDISYTTALSILRDASLAEDVLQDVYTQIWKNARAYNPALGKPIAWVVTLTRNKALDRLRSGKRREALLETFSEVAHKSPGFAQAADSNDTKDVAETLKKTLERFPLQQRRALELALFEGLTHAEVAKVLKEPLGTVKAWIRRGVIDLRERLRKIL